MEILNYTTHNCIPRRPPAVLPPNHDQSTHTRPYWPGSSCYMITMMVLRWHCRLDQRCAYEKCNIFTLQNIFAVEGGGGTAPVFFVSQCCKWYWTVPSRRQPLKMASRRWKRRGQASSSLSRSMSKAPSRHSIGVQPHKLVQILCDTYMQLQGTDEFITFYWTLSHLQHREQKLIISCESSSAANIWHRVEACSFDQSTMWSISVLSGAGKTWSSIS